jgi:hypothetical protein
MSLYVALCVIANQHISHLNDACCQSAILDLRFVKGRSGNESYLYHEVLTKLYDLNQNVPKNNLF